MSDPQRAQEEVRGAQSIPGARGDLEGVNVTPPLLCQKRGLPRTLEEGSVQIVASSSGAGDTWVTMNGIIANALETVPERDLGGRRGWF